MKAIKIRAVISLALGSSVARTKHMGTVDVAKPPLRVPLTEPDAAH